MSLKGVIRYKSVLLFPLVVAVGFCASNSSYPQLRTPNPPTVRIVFSPIDSHGSIITDLAQNDIQVFDDGLQQSVTSFKRIDDQSLAVALLVDTSLSQQRLQKTAKLIARLFVEGILRTGRDQAAVIGFSGKGTVEQELTTDQEKVAQAVERLHFATLESAALGAIIAGKTIEDPEFQLKAATAIWDTVWNASEGLTFSSDIRTRRAILLISDGEDTLSHRSINDAIERAQRYDVAVFVIGIGDKTFTGVRQSVLKKLAEQTGGRFFFPRTIPEVQDIFFELRRELRSPYVVTYTPVKRKLHDGVQKVTIQLSNPSLRTAIIDYRRGYISPQH